MREFLWKISEYTTLLLNFLIEGSLCALYINYHNFSFMGIPALHSATYNCPLENTE